MTQNAFTEPDGRKRIIIELVFDVEKPYEDEDYESLELVAVNRLHSDLGAGQLVGLGESIAQTDSWQVDHWIDIQEAIAGETGQVHVT